MKCRARITYRGFWDVPRIFLIRHAGQTFLFDGVFDEELDDYPDAYKVFAIPEIPDDELPGDWTTLAQRAIRFVGRIPVSAVQFDASRRESMDATVLDTLLAGASAVP